jgi:sulfate adenylyltransferase subunit 2
MDYLSELESESIYIIREAYHRYRRLGLLWSMGKDSTTLLWLCRKAFLGRVPFPVLHIDTSYKFEEMYRFRDRLAAEWKLDLLVRRNERALAAGMCPDRFGTLECCNALKTTTLKEAIAELALDAVLLGIRRDEHGIRAKERYFSPRDEESRWHYENQPPELWDLYKSAVQGTNHVRVHPLLHMTELDIWRYIQREKIPLVEIYFARDKTRFRSIGCKSCCRGVPSEASSIEEIIMEIGNSNSAERAGRAQDKEEAYLMQKLRSLGYM